jgi:hypothetical protein
MDQFMKIQNELLLEQLEQLNRCELGIAIMGCSPHSVEEFRARVPLTTYKNYAPYLLKQREDILPEKALLWQHTSGRSAEYDYKWVPVTERMYRELGDLFMALLIFASCENRNEVFFNEHDRFLYGLAPPPYASGCWARRLDEDGLFDFLPPIDKAEAMPFQQRIEEGFKMGLNTGIDVVAAISSMLVAMGERFNQAGNSKNIKNYITRPGLMVRLIRALVNSKREGRPLLPRDIWKLKALVSTGTDSIVYREKIHEMWGRYPLDVYGCTESIIIAMQTWDYGSMTFVPNLNFLEFLPVDQYRRWRQDPEFKPALCTINQVQPGQKYLTVVTNFLGGAFVRYVIGDIVHIVSLQNEKLNINIPQMVFYSRADDVLDFTYTSFTEKTIWQAIEASGVRYADWVARKEFIDGRAVLSLYIEQKEQNKTASEIRDAVDGYLSGVKEDYNHMITGMGFGNILKVILLPEGAFWNYMQIRQNAGADLAHLKPPRINPTDEIINALQTAPEAIRVKV